MLFCTSNRFIFLQITLQIITEIFYICTCLFLHNTHVLSYLCYISFCTRMVHVHVVSENTGMSIYKHVLSETFHTDIKQQEAASARIHTKTTDSSPAGDTNRWMTQINLSSPGGSFSCLILHSYLPLSLSVTFFRITDRSPLVIWMSCRNTLFLKHSCWSSWWAL